MASRYRRTATFTARSNDGAEYAIVEETLVDEYYADGQHKEVYGTKRYRTSQGEVVKRVAKGKYQIVGRIGPTIDLTSDDPNAP